MICNDSQYCRQTTVQRCEAFGPAEGQVYGCIDFGMVVLMYTVARDWL